MAVGTTFEPLGAIEARHGVLTLHEHAIHVSVFANRALQYALRIAGFLVSPASSLAHLQEEPRFIVGCDFVISFTVAVVSSSGQQRTSRFAFGSDTLQPHYTEYEQERGNQDADHDANDLDEASQRHVHILGDVVQRDTCLVHRQCGSCFAASVVVALRSSSAASSWIAGAIEATYWCGVGAIVLKRATGAPDAIDSSCSADEHEGEETQYATH